MEHRKHSTQLATVHTSGRCSGWLGGWVPWARENNCAQRALAPFPHVIMSVIWKFGSADIKMVKISGNSNFTNTQINEVVYGNAVMKVGITAEEVPAVIDQIARLQVECGFSDPKLDEVLVSAQSQKGGTEFISKIVEYAVSLKALNDAGTLIAVYGSRAADFLGGLQSVLFL